MVVEDGTGRADADSYVSLEDADAYHQARSNSGWTDVPSSPAPAQKEAALIRATAAIDARYRGRFPGSRANGRAQALEWPRIDAYDREGEEIAATEIPVEIKNAVCEAALRELAEPGSMAPDLERGGALKRVKAGSVEIEYAGNASAETTFTAIDNALSGLLQAASPYTGRAVRS